MKNKIKLKQLCIILMGLALIFLLVMAFSLRAQYRIFTANYNKKLDAVTGKLLEHDPELDVNALIKLLNEDIKKW